MPKTQTLDPEAHNFDRRTQSYAGIQRIRNLAVFPLVANRDHGWKVWARERRSSTHNLPHPIIPIQARTLSISYLIAINASFGRVPEIFARVRIRRVPIV